MAFDFDQPIDRSKTNSIKWRRYGPRVLPLWVADMDFAAPQPVLEALRAATAHGVFGYELPSLALREVVAARMERLYGWKVSPAAVVATPGIVAALAAAAHGLGAPGEGVLVQPPVYPPFLKVPGDAGLVLQTAGMRCAPRDRILRYEVDWDAFEAALGSGARTSVFLLCSPHNPTGQVFSRADLLRIAEICLKRDVLICSDEIHSELLLGSAAHLPIAALSPEIAARTVTLVAPSKTFNVPGLFCGFAIIPDRALRDRFKKALEGMALHVNNLGLVAAQAAFSGQCDDWLAALRRYLTANRDALAALLRGRLPGIRFTVPDATYLAWLDCRELAGSGRIQGSPHAFFLKKAGVALNDGGEFGPGGEGFVRLNFGCPRRTLEAALERMRAALGI
jgi:cystathionine beta-lyase